MYAGDILAISVRVTFELIFSHLVSVNSIWNLAPLTITRFALRNHTPFGDSLARRLTSECVIDIRKCSRTTTADSNCSFGRKIIDAPTRRSSVGSWIEDPMD